VANVSASERKETDESLQSAIIKGMKERAAIACQDLCATLSPLEIIEKHIVPALDTIGKAYEEKRAYLPQLLMSAEAAKSAFERMKTHLLQTGETQNKKCEIVLATVHGDIHDIGKNIVKTLLENYGFAVVDLGRDVPVERIVDETVKRHAPIVGLSALMTTTVPSMQATIKALRESAPWCKIIVGGAVLTEDYAKKIGADAYGKDALCSVRYAESVYQDLCKNT
jgi:5-methyltetrahydrofolate--homocysteine methyltransferase